MSDPAYEPQQDENPVEEPENKSPREDSPDEPENKSPKEDLPEEPQEQVGAVEHSPSGQQIELQPQSSESSPKRKEESPQDNHPKELHSVDITQEESKTEGFPTVGDESQIVTDRNERRILFHMGSGPEDKNALQIPCLLIAITVLVGFLFFKVVSVFHGGADYDLTDLQSQHKIIYDYLSKPPITHFKTVKANEKCPDGYYPQLLTYWYGLQNGCYCKETDTLVSGSCPYSCRERQPVKAQPSKPIYNWSSGEQICVKYASNYTPNRVQCPPGFKVCDDSTCYLESEGCPEMKFTLSDQKISFFQPLIGMALTLSNSSLCIYPSFYADSPSNKIYDLEIILSGCGDLGEYFNAVNLAKTSAYELYKQNGINVDELPHKEVLKEEMYYLWGIHAMGFTQDVYCTEPDPSLFPSWYNQYWRLRSTVGTIQLICALAAFVCLLMYAIIFFEHYKETGSISSVLDNPIESPSLEWASNIVFLALLPGLSVIEFILVLVMRSPLDKTYQLFKRLAGSFCFEQENFNQGLESYVEFYEDDVNSLLWLAITMTLISMLMLTLYLTSKKAGKGPYVSLRR